MAVDRGLRLLCVGVLVAGFFFFRSTNNPALNKRSSTNFDPYKGSLSDLLLPQLGSDIDVIKFKLASKKDATTEFQKTAAGVTEGMVFVYDEEAGMGSMKISFTLEGRIADFISSKEALVWFEESARDMNVAPGPRKTESVLLPA
ncbi:MAG: hypothetical protein M3N48_13835 [Verrucomicrobiota bacterium]|nr:hypothetical protein [Verrucomicrobiota bacterium]